MKLKHMKPVFIRFFVWIGAAMLLAGAVGCKRRIESTEDQEPTGPDAGNSGVWITQLDAPGAYTADFSSGNPPLTVRVCADVILPDVSALPVCRIIPGKITQDVVDRVCRMFLTDAVMYREEEYQVTDERWDGKLYVAERVIPGGDAGTERFLGVQAAEARGRLLDRSLFIWNESDFRDGLRAKDPWGGYSVTPARSGAELRYIDNRQSKQYGVRWQVYRDVTGQCEVDEAAAAFLALTPAEAAERAQAVFDELGLPVMVESVWLCANGAVARGDDGAMELVNTPKQFCYRVRLVHRLAGVPSVLLNATTEITDAAGDALWAWIYGDSYLYLDDEGVFELGYYAPLEITEELNANAKLLPFDEIMGVFERMLPAVYRYGRFEPFDKKTVKINRITLGMMRLSDAGSIESGTLVPAWSFYGEEDTVFSAMKNREQSDLYRIGLPFLIINAMDGSVIDITQGF